MTHKYDPGVCFSTSYAVRYGVDEAIVIQEYESRDRYDRTNLPAVEAVQDGVRGVFFSRRDVAAFFPFWTFERFREIVWSLVDQGAMDYANREPEGLIVWMLDATDGEEEGQPPGQTEAMAPMPLNVATPTQKESPGYVYVLRSQDGLYKIGKSKEPQTRIRALGVLLPFEIETLHIIYSRDYHRAERYLHERYAHARGRGEWFELTDADLAWIMSLTEL